MIQIYDMDLDDDENRQIAEAEVERKFRKPLSGYAFPRVQMYASKASAG
jgi:hypothetical protein